MNIGKSIPRIDAREKLTGKAMYTDDLVPDNHLVAKVLHSTIGNGLVEEIDTKEAMAIPGVVHILTCFDVPDRPFCTATGPWHKNPDMRLPADRLLLNRRVRYYGDDVAVVVAENEIAADRALKAIKIRYTEYPVVMDAVESMKGTKVPVHESHPNNILRHMHHERGDFEKYSKEEGVVKVEGWYERPPVQHVPLENATSFAYMKDGKITVYTSTQCPHLVRNFIADAIGKPWGDVRVVKPYVGGGFGVKTDALYEPLNAYLTMILGGRCIKLETSREENFVSTRTRHGVKLHIISYVRKDGTIAATKLTSYTNAGAYGSYSPAVGVKPIHVANLTYKADAFVGDAYTVYTNLLVSGAQRGFGFPQITFAMESHMDDIAKAINMDPTDLRKINLIEVGYKDDILPLTYHTDGWRQSIDKGIECTDYWNKKELYKNENKRSSNVKRGIGMGLFWYRTATYPDDYEMGACRMMMNQDGSLQVMMPEPDIGQGSNTVLTQLAADTVGVPFEKVHFVNTQDTDVTPWGIGAYASRVTYIGGMAIHKTGTLLKQKILTYVSTMLNHPEDKLDIVDGNVVDKESNKQLISLYDLAMEAGTTWTPGMQKSFSAETSLQCQTNALSVGACFAEVEVDIKMCKLKVLNVVNIHDCGTVINPQLAEAQVHGGISMELGAALSEELLFDDKGKCLNPNMLDYKTLTAVDHPDRMEGYFIENPEPTSPYGTKALGESTTCPISAAIRNAVMNATGVAFNNLPLNPHNLFKRFVEKGLIKKEENEHV